MHLRILATALFAAATTASFAADEIAELEPVVVTATRTETPVEALPVPVVVIDRATIERNAGATLPDLLRLAAGVEIAQSGGPGQLATVFLRGAESDHVLVLVDGVELSPGSIGTPRLQDIDPAMIERIEIVKGPRSALYGSEAVGGVINIITRRDADAVRARIGGGSYGTYEAGGGARVGNEKISLDFDINHRRSDGFPPLASSDIDRGYENTNANIRLAADFGPVAAVMHHFRTIGTSEYLDFMAAPASQDFDNQVTEAKLSWTRGTWRSSASLSRSHDELEQVESIDYAITDRDVLDWQNDLSFGKHVITGGVYLENEKVDAESYGRTLAETDVRALYLQEQWQGERVDLVLAARGTDHERFGRQFSWNTDFGLQFAEDWRLQANAGRAFRAPNATFLYGPFGANPALEPEVSLNRELGVHWDGESQSASLTVFRNDIDQMIDFDLPTFTYRNISNVRIEGVELGHEWRSDHWSGRTNLTLQQPENASTDEDLLRRARKILGLAVQRHFTAFDVGVDLRASGPRPDIDINTFGPVREPGYVLVNATLDWQLAGRWALAARLENLLDAEYETASGYNTADRGIFVTLRYTMLD